jgi:hypothetical protein
MMTMIRVLAITFVLAVFLLNLAEKLSGCQQIPAGDLYDKQAKLVGFVQHRGFTEVYFVLRSNCWCDTVIINYQWEKASDQILPDISKTKNIPFITRMAKLLVFQRTNKAFSYSS